MGAGVLLVGFAGLDFGHVSLVHLRSAIGKAFLFLFRFLFPFMVASVTAFKADESGYVSRMLIADEGIMLYI